MKDILHSPDVAEIARATPRAFSMATRFTLPDALSFYMFRNGTVTNQDLAAHFSFVDKEPISKQGLFKALNKVDSQAFPFILNRYAVDFYKRPYHTYRGYTLFAIDGSLFDLPLSKEMQERYGGNQNQYAPTIYDIKKPQAKGSMLFDITNHLIVDARIAPYKTSEIPLLFQHLENCKGLMGRMKPLLLADRYYGSAELFLYCMMNGISFCIRGKSNFYKKYVENVEHDGVIEIPLDKAWIRRLRRNDCKMYAEKTGNIRLRVVKGRYEYCLKKKTEIIESIYFTNLSADEFTTEEIISLYHNKRWEIETAYHVLKNHLEAERFNSSKYNIVTNEIYGKMVCYNIASLFYEQADMLTTDGTVYEQIPNMKNIVDTIRREKTLIKEMYLKNRMLKKKEWNSYIHGLIRRFSKETVPVRPDRHVKRWGRWMKSIPSNRFRLDGRRNPCIEKCYGTTGYKTRQR